jgi:hypothetical protein
MNALLPLALALLAAPVAALAGRLRVKVKWAALAGAAMAGLGFCAVLWSWGERRAAATTIRPH